MLNVNLQRPGFPIERFEWWYNQDSGPITYEDCRYVVDVYADGDELDLIKLLFGDSIVFTPMRSMRWFDETAKMIAHAVNYWAEMSQASKNRVRTQGQEEDAVLITISSHHEPDRFMMWRAHHSSRKADRVVISDYGIFAVPANRGSLELVGVPVFDY